ncbi:hypothetical protein AXF42_Ash005229 [Apostasia shenzhenica]|uniref:Ectonucleotide pyrophosphatase/phosphodiesterase family member 3 n=1 Tax=Apostasia shenzhenica TaxID=1088818 RepID=A0A2I0B6B4_9ASPA|nr:hypothetical protein AXF42_Ash005229 [Apostasia shenzhenica]
MASASFSISASPPSNGPNEEFLPTPSTALLRCSPPPSPPKNPIIFSVLLVITVISLALAAAFAFFLFSPAPSSPSPAAAVSTIAVAPKPMKLKARPLSNLSRPTVILISSDGFRHGYQHKAPLPNIHRLIANGTEAVPGLIPVFPTLTFPNHYSIVTGLYPPSHGIIENQFVDPDSGDRFTMASREPQWWLGEPLWETVVNHGLAAATCFWPGSEVIKGSWNCSPDFCRKYDESLPFEVRVDSVLSYFDLPNNQIPSFISLYFEEPDRQGHIFGPDDPEITSAVLQIDQMIGRLIQGLENRGVFDDVSIILLSDHGMVGNCDKKLIFLEDLSPWIKILPDWIQSYSPLLAIRPPSGSSLSETVAKMNEGLKSGKVENGGKLKVFRKEDLPERLHYADSYRIPPVIGIVEEGYKVELVRSEKKECGGAHGYDNSFYSMRTIFVAHGPQFEGGRKVGSFENVEIYNVIAKILKLKGPANNGSVSFPESLLLPDD